MPFIVSRTVKFENNVFVSAICGELDSNLKKIEIELNVEIIPRGNLISIHGSEKDVEKTISVLKFLYNSAKQNNFIDYGELRGAINMSDDLKLNGDKGKNVINSLFVKAGKKLLKPRSINQKKYFQLVKDKEMIFCCGPAGTGKTYLAVAFAISMLKSGQVEKIILSRPAVEAGERLGFLP